MLLVENAMGKRKPGVRPGKKADAPPTVAASEMDVAAAATRSKPCLIMGVRGLVAAVGRIVVDLSLLSSVWACDRATVHQTT